MKLKMYVTMKICPVVLHFCSCPEVSVEQKKRKCNHIKSYLKWNQRFLLLLLFFYICIFVVKKSLRIKMQQVRLASFGLKSLLLSL